MLFSSLIFLFGFLPVTLAVYFLTPARLRNLLLLLASLFFYAWGEPVFVLALAASVLWNYCWGLALGRAKCGKIPLILGVAGNLLLLFYFKYLNFTASVLSRVLERIGCSPWEIRYVILPVGISFFTFQSISYLADVYRDRSLCRRNFTNLALYITLFPQLIAGPIVRYGAISRELDERRSTLFDTAEGLQQFLFGLGAKVLLANPAGEIADRIFAIPAGELSARAAWLGVIAYSLQIYYDFSGYSSMAIGLGRIFGFHFPVNFNYPYVAGSISDFWRRWHISLSTWFRDYVYIPLGGSRGSDGRTACNLMIVFLLTGIWHGASWNFLVWGLWYGVLLVAEKFLFRGRLPGWAMRIWTLLAVVNGWVIFRSETLGGARDFFRSMYGGGAAAAIPLHELCSGREWFFLAAGILLAAPWAAKLFGKPPVGRIVSLLILILSLAALARGAYNPFLYFRF